MVRLVLEYTQECDYIWFIVFSEFTSTWWIVYATALWQSLTSSNTLKLMINLCLNFYNKCSDSTSISVKWFYMIFNREETFTPTSWARIMKNFRPQTAKKAQCSSCLLETQLQFFLPFFFFQTTQCRSPLSILYLRPKVHPLLVARARTSAFSPLSFKYRHQKWLAEAPDWSAAHHSLVLCLVVSYALMTSDWDTTPFSSWEKA